MTGDTWHVTRDTWHITHSMGWTFIQNFTSLALPVWDWQCLEYIWLTESINQSIDRGDCRTAAATPGLLKTTPNVTKLKSSNGDQTD